MNGRNEITWRKRFEQDIWYIENVSLLLDLWIAWHTIMIVLWRKGVSNGEHVTMPTLHEELESKRVVCEQLEEMPQILADLVRNNPNAIISFSLYDEGNVHPTSKTPQHIFAYHQCADGENLKYKNVYINIWRCLNGCFNAFLMGTAGPFSVEISNNSVIITQKSTTTMRYDRQLKYVMREISA